TCRTLPILDRLNSIPDHEARVYTPEEMAGQWREISAITGVAIDPGLWTDDPPQSTWPACLAVKAAERQGLTLCAQFLKILRANIMQKRRNGSRREVLAEVAHEAGLDIDRFQHDLTYNRDDLEQEVADDKRHAEANCVDRTPALLIKNDTGDKTLIVGLRDYSLFRQAAQTLLAEQREREERLARL
ncbi:MAG: DsbA family protein, partial [Armatimonadota bacterium]|nr:DsbA family protein [Armatimonadota bacterium]